MHTLNSSQGSNKKMQTHDDNENNVRMTAHFYKVLPVHPAIFSPTFPVIPVAFL